VRRAQGSRAAIQRIGDRVSSIFVPVVVLIAVATAIAYGWHGAWETGIINAAAVLIVACPCAMGLATPAAIMAGANAAAKRGILVRDGTALEKCGRVTAILFDKTGTITEGKPRMEKFVTLDDQENARAIARALAVPSRHPYSQAVARALKDCQEIAITGWREERGDGVSGTVEGKDYFLGSIKALKSRAIDLAGLPELSGSMLGLVANGRLLAAISLDDPLKAGVAEMIQHLGENGLRTYLVSGDREAVVRELAASAGVAPENVFAEVRPDEKAGIVTRLQAAGERVAFVGDGINDAPALAQADLGIAVMQASDVAREAADILLLNAGIDSIPLALDICRATLRTIKQNLFWAFVYNAAAIPLAVAGLLPPAACAAAMAASDLCVIGNSLRLLRKGRR